MKNFPRSFLKFAVSITASLLIGWWAYLQSGSPEYRADLRFLDWHQIPLLSGLIILSGLMRSLRLGKLFQSSYKQLGRTIKMLFFSLSFSFLLGGVGFIIRLMVLRRGIQARHVVSLGLTSVEKLTDALLAFIVFFFLFAVPHAQNPVFEWIETYKVAIALPLFLSLLWFYFHHAKIIRWALGVLKAVIHPSPLPDRYYYFFKRQAYYLYRSLQSLPPRRMAVFLLHSLIVFFLEGLFFYLGLSGLGVDLEFSQALLLNAVLLLALIIPVFPSGIGIFQATMVFVLGGESVFYASLLLHFILIVTHLIIVSLGIYQFMDLFKITTRRSWDLNEKP